MVTEQSTQRPAAPRPVTPVGILAQILGQLVADQDQILDPHSDPVLREQWQQRLVRARDLAAGLDPYLIACTSPESAALAGLAQQTATEDWGRRNREAGGSLEQEMLSGPLEGQMLRMLVKMLKAERILEIGLFTGYSALAMAEALPPDGRVVGCELDPYVAAFAQRWFGQSPHGSKIEVRVGPALQTLQTLADQGSRFDLVFVDADKGGYVDYFECLLDRELLAPGGVIAVDNTLLQGQPYLAERSPNGEAIARFNQVVAADPRVEQVLVPLRDGLTLIRRVDEVG